MPRDTDRARRENRTSLLPEDMPLAVLDRLGRDTLSDVTAELDRMVEGVRPDPADFEQALDGLSIPGLGELHAETTVLPESVTIDPSEADLLLDQQGNVIEAGEQAAETAGEIVEIAVDESGEAATVVVDAGSEAIEIVADVGSEAVTAGEAASEAANSEVAAETVVEVVAAALEV